SGSTTYVAIPVIHACPPSVGTTAAYFPTPVSSTSRPGKTVPNPPGCRKSWVSESFPFAYSVAIFAHVPVPQGERSITPVHVLGLFQSSSPVETTTQFCQSASSLSGGPE